MTEQELRAIVREEIALDRVSRETIAEWYSMPGYQRGRVEVLMRPKNEDNWYEAESYTDIYGRHIDFDPDNYFYKFGSTT